MTQDDQASGGIAIVGMSGRFPGARNVDAFWSNICDSVDSVSHFSPSELEITPEDGTGADYVCAKGILDDVDMFDARFFGYLPKDAEVMDPQHRMFLEICWEAIEHAGHDPSRYPGSVGVFGGCYMDTYLLNNLCSDEKFRQRLVESIQVGTLQTELGNDKDYLATRVAFKLGLRGPAMTLQTACSTSLVAIATACQSLETYGCDMALAGGVTIVLPQYKGYTYKEGSMLSPDGVCRPFDQNAAGTVFSNGAAVLLLKRVEDAIEDGDTIYAVIRGYATNNDGDSKLSYTAPSVDGQADVISTALGMAGIDARSIGYVEAHGTATPLGDPIEIAGLTNAYGIDTADKQYCALGSVKANLGHLDVASGAIGLIKTSLMIHHDVMPRLNHFEAPNPNIDFAQTPFFIPKELSDWSHTEGPRRAGVSSFGVGGTNAHVVLEEAPPQPSVGNDNFPQLFCLSARTADALNVMSGNLADALDRNEHLSLENVAYTLQVGRQKFEHRRTVVASDRETEIEKLRNACADPTGASQVAQNTVFLFPGQATQYPGMGRDLYAHHPTCRAIIDTVAEIALTENPALGDIRDLINWSEDSEVDRSEAEARIKQTDIAQPIIFAIEAAVFEQLREWGIRPSAVVGHSVGEIAAFYACGRFSLTDAARLSIVRGRLMQKMDHGAMLAIRGSRDAITPYLSADVSIAGFNSPAVTIVSGPHANIDRLFETLQDTNLYPIRLQTSHAFHSMMMAQAADPLVAFVEGLESHPSQISLYSTLTGGVLENEGVSAEYWGQQLTSPVKFEQAIRAAAASHDAAAFVEIGAGQVLTGLTSQNLPDVNEEYFVSSMGPAADPGNDCEFLLSAVGSLWALGAEPDWEALHAGPRQRVPLPTYPFERKRFWVEPKVRDESKSEPAAPRQTDAVSGDVQNLVREQLKIVSAQLDALAGTNRNGGSK